MHFSAVQSAGFRRLQVGAEVEAVVEPADQDGYAYRAVAVWLSRSDGSPR